MQADEDNAEDEEVVDAEEGKSGDDHEDDEDDHEDDEGDNDGSNTGNGKGKANDKTNKDKGKRKSKKSKSKSLDDELMKHYQVIEQGSACNCQCVICLFSCQLAEAIHVRRQCHRTDAEQPHVGTAEG